MLNLLSSFCHSGNFSRKSLILSENYKFIFVGVASGFHNLRIGPSEKLGNFITYATIYRTYGKHKFRVGGKHLNMSMYELGET